MFLKIMGYNTKKHNLSSLDFSQKFSGRAQWRNAHWLGLDHELRAPDS